jgi:CubicO group peptidase (beta-lactamase class C family)
MHVTCYLKSMRSYLVAALLLSAVTASAQLPADTETKIAAIANDTLKQTGVPSASVAVAVDGKLAYAQAFGLANVAPAKPATAQMAYPIGSISKQFTATALLLLQQQGKLSLDDKVSKYFPELTRANEVSLRNLMTMTSGYEDFAPQDYIIPDWYKQIAPLANVHVWAGKPLDFTPGTDWQYSNTNYVLLGLVVEKVSGKPLYQFLRENLFTPLHLDGVFNTYTQREKLEVTGYVSNAMAPVRVLPLEAPGWYFGDGDLSMPASTLVAWDLGIMQQKLLTPASYKQFEMAFVFPSGPKSGQSSNYGLGIFVQDRNGHRMIEHGGEVGGYVSENIVFPDDKIAVVVLTNEVASSAASKIGAEVAKLLDSGIVAPVVPDTLAASLKTILTGMQTSQIDRSLFTSNCNAYFDANTLADFQSTLAPLGAITDVKRTRTNLRGGMTFGAYQVTFANGTRLSISTYLKPDGKIEQLLITGKA